jgi:predicted phage replisome organizer
MSNNMNYYYIKLKDNYFEQDNIKVLESMKNGHTYSLIIIKLYLKSSKYDGRLMMTSSIPYDPAKIEILASVIGHDVAHVREAIKIARELDLITIVDGREIWMTEIQNFIGSSSTEADRKRDYRKRIESDTPITMGHLSGHLSDVRPPEIELEKEIKKDSETDKPKDEQKSVSCRFTPPSVQEVEQYCKERNYGIDAEAFVAFYESKGWLIGKAKMKNWKSAVVTWVKREFAPSKQARPNDINIARSIWEEA